MKYEVCISIDGKECRMPPVSSKAAAEVLAKLMKSVYPKALIEIAHDGVRECR